MARARILVADDHKRVRDTVVHLLNREFDVLEAVTDGKELLEAAERLKPDLCVLDISMPNMSGIEAITQLKQNGSPVKVIFLTIHNDEDFVGEAFRNGAEGYVIKSRMAADLRVAIREVLAGGTFVSSFEP